MNAREFLNGGNLEMSTDVRLAMAEKYLKDLLPDPVEFEKWYAKEYPLPVTMERGPIGKDHKEGCRKSWNESRIQLRNC